MALSEHPDALPADAGKAEELPANHGPNVAPVLEPTLRAGLEKMLTATGVSLAAVHANS